MPTNNTHDSISKLAKAVHEATDAIIKAKLVPEQATPSVAAMLAASANDLNSKLRGSLLRINKAGGAEYRVVPPGSDDAQRRLRQSPALTDLLRFSMSDRYHELREQLGLAS